MNEHGTASYRYISSGENLVLPLGLNDYLVLRYYEIRPSQRPSMHLHCHAHFASNYNKQVVLPKVKTRKEPSLVSQVQLKESSDCPNNSVVSSCMA